MFHKHAEVRIVVLRDHQTNNLKRNNKQYISLMSGLDKAFKNVFDDSLKNLDMLILMKG